MPGRFNRLRLAFHGNCKVIFNWLGPASHGGEIESAYEAVVAVQQFQLLSYTHAQDTVQDLL